MSMADQKNKDLVMIGQIMPGPAYDKKAPEGL